MPFDTLPHRIVVKLITTIVFYINTFIWTKGILDTLPPLIIVEGTVINYHLHFKVIYSEYLQTYKGTYNDISISSGYSSYESK